MPDLTVEGKIATPVEVLTSTNGKVHCKFALKAGKKLVDCIVWAHMCQDTCDMNSLKQGAEIIVKGFYGNKGEQKDIFGEGKGAPKEFVIKWFGPANVPSEEESWDQRYERYRGGPKKAKQCFRDFLIWKKNEGQIWAGVGPGEHGWKPKAECVCMDGEWLWNIWYCQLVLTPEYVDKQFKRFARSVPLIKKEDVPRYKAFLSRLLQKAERIAPLDRSSP